MENFQESMDKLNQLREMTDNHIKQMEEDYLKHYMETRNIKVGDIVQYRGFVQYEGYDVVKYAIITKMECEFINDRKWDDPNKSDIDNRFYIHMDSYDILDSGVSKRNNHYTMEEYEVLCSQDRLKEICDSMGMKFKLNRKVLKQITNVTIESI